MDDSQLRNQNLDIVLDAPSHTPYTLGVRNGISDVFSLLKRPFRLTNVGFTIW